jgi:amino acid transporter
MAGLAFLVPTVAALEHVATLDLFGDVGTCAAFGFVVAYCLVTVAAPAYLRQLGALRTRDLAGCGASLGLLIVPAVGSVYPLPPAPVMYFPYAFLAYLLAGTVWIMSVYRRRPEMGALARKDLARAHNRFQPERPAGQSVAVSDTDGFAPDRA